MATHLSRRGHEREWVEFGGAWLERQWCSVNSSQVDPATLQRQAERLQGWVAMGGFVISLEQAKRGVLGAEEDARTQRTHSLSQTLAEVRLSRQSSLGPTGWRVGA